jgi:hypothetical protein
MAEGMSHRAKKKKEKRLKPTIIASNGEKMSSITCNIEGEEKGKNIMCQQ